MSKVLERIRWLRASTRPPHKERNETRRDRSAGGERFPTRESTSYSYEG
jgi:hypothetical protein